MEIFPGGNKQISVYASTIIEGTESMADTGKELSVVWQNLEQANTQLTSSLEGEIKTIYGGAQETTEKHLNQTGLLINQLSVQLNQYKQDSMKINWQADMNAGGNTYE